MAADETKPLRCALDLKDVPPSAYRLPGDGRNWQHLCVQRQRVVDKLTLYANSDGTGITVGVPRLAAALGVAPRSVKSRFEELNILGILTTAGREKTRGVFKRTLNVAAILALAAKATGQDSPYLQGNLRATGQDSALATGQLTKATGQDTVPTGQVTRATGQLTQATGQDSGTSAHTVLPPLPLSPPTAPQNATAWAGVDAYVRSNVQAWGLPSKQDWQAIQRLFEKHGATKALAALKKFLNRPKGFEKLRNPWAFFDWQELIQQIDFEDAQYAAQVANNEIAARAFIEEASRALGSTPPAVGRLPGGIEDFLAD
jgi:hypothetical protein